MNETTLNQEDNDVTFEYDLIRVTQTHSGNNVHLSTALLQSQEWIDV